MTSTAQERRRRRAHDTTVHLLNRPPSFPCAVPLRLVDGPRDAPEGTEEGALCCRPTRIGICLGKLELRRNDDLGGCACFISAPCGSCMSQVPECPGCGHREPEPD